MVAAAGVAVGGFLIQSGASSKKRTRIGIEKFRNMSINFDKTVSSLSRDISHTFSAMRSVRSVGGIVRGKFITKLPQASDAKNARLFVWGSAIKRANFGLFMPVIRS